MSSALTIDDKSTKDAIADLSEWVEEIITYMNNVNFCSI